MTGEYWKGRDAHRDLRSIYDHEYKRYSREEREFEDGFRAAGRVDEERKEEEAERTRLENERWHRENEREIEEEIADQERHENEQGEDE